MPDPEYHPENQKTVTGFAVQEIPERMRHPDLYRHIFWHSPTVIPRDYPRLALMEDAVQAILQTSPEGYALAARVSRGRRKQIFSTDLTLRTPLLRKLQEQEGVEFSAPMYCAVLGDEKLKGFFPFFDVSFVHNFDGVWRNVINGQTVTGEVRLDIREKRFMIFEKAE